MEPDQALIHEIRQMLLHGQETDIASISNSLPFPYFWIPGELRMLLSRVIFRKHVRCLKKNGKIHAPANDTLDQKALQLARFDPGNLWQWPNDHSCAFVLSHDVDTAGQESGIREIMQVARERNIRSTFSFVLDSIPHYHDLLLEMLADGFEVALHDVVHDNRICSLTEEQIVKRLLPAQEAIERYGIKGFRSPSWYVSSSLWSALERLGFDYDMSALDSWPFFQRGMEHGVSTFFPFMVGELVVLPSTIPFEMPWHILGMAKKDVRWFWTEKIQRLAHAGGLILVDAHPDRWLCGKRSAADHLREVMDYILQTHNPVVMQASAVARYTRQMNDEGAMLLVPGACPLRIPRRNVKGTIH
ncbi:MAG: polysaccharide deacetylase family protein [Magnetococcus sp. DMHC-6]